MSYCVLSYEIRPETLNLVSDFIRKPVGRPSKTNPPMAPIEVAKNLTYTDHSPIVGLSKTSKAKEACGQLFTIGNVNSTTEEGETDGLDSINQMSKEETKIPLKSVAPMEQLTTQSEIRLHLNSKCPWVNSNRSRVLIGASWMVEEDKRQFLRYPEVLFMDATHKTNNEGRPLLLICGRDSDGKAFVILRVFMPNETSAFYNWVFQEALPSMLGKEHLERVNLVLTDGDSNEFSALENSMLKLLPNALRGRCGHHLIKKTLQKKSIAPSYFKNRVLGEAILQEIEGWVRSWADGSSCLTEEEFMFSKNLLLDELRNNEQLQEVMGLESVGKLMDWVDTDVLPHEKNFAHYMKRDHRCLGEYVTNATEGLNYAAKHSSMSAKPDQKMVTSAGAMHSHDDMKNRERKKKKLRQFEDTPLFLERGNKRHNSDCFKELVPIGRSIMMDQVEQSAGNYVVAQISPDSFCVILDQSHVSRPHGCPAWFKGRPRFRSVNIVEVDKEDSNRVVLKCSCRHKQHYGLPCRHLLSIEHQYDLSDIACRWRNDYDLYAYSNGKEKTMTRLFAELSKVEHQGILVKSEFFGIRLMCIPHFIPVNKSGTGRLVDLGLLF
ncbi:unnamed protein product [Cylindrotheca closterium]|nr:unnamed protein product [Cylindrotheca closterium]